jgi:hypothetical protein
LNLDGWKQTPEHQKHWVAKDWILNYDGKCEAADPHLWTTKSYRDFVMICDWRWTDKGAGEREAAIFVRGDQKNRVKLTSRKPAGEWNRAVVTMRGERGTVEVNGAPATQIMEFSNLPPEGPVGLQHHGSAVQFANIYIKEL